MQFGWTGKLNTSHHITFTGCTGCTGALNTNHHITLTGWTGELKTSHHITLTGCTGWTGEQNTSHHITFTGCSGWTGELSTSHHITLTGCTGWCTGELNTNHHITLTGCTGWTGELSRTSHDLIECADVSSNYQHHKTLSLTDWLTATITAPSTASTHARRATVYHCDIHSQLTVFNISLCRQMFSTATCWLWTFCPVVLVIYYWNMVYSRYGDGAGNTVEENSSVFSLIRMR